MAFSWIYEVLRKITKIQDISMLVKMCNVLALNQDTEYICISLMHFTMLVMEFTLVSALVEYWMITDTEVFYIFGWMTGNSFGLYFGNSLSQCTHTHTHTQARTRTRTHRDAEHQN
jgi:hypothetical protein